MTRPLFGRRSAIAGVLLSSAAALSSASPPIKLVDVATASTDPSNLPDSEPSIAVNPKNPNEIAIVTFSEGWGPASPAPIWRSTDGGATWTKVKQIPQPPTNDVGPGDQKIAFDAAGNLFVAELDFGDHDFVYRQTGGANDPLTPGASYGDDQPHLDVDRESQGPCFNRVYSPWLDTNTFPGRSTVSFSTDSGVSLTSVAAGGNSAFSNRTTRIALASDGKAYVIYKTREGGTGGGFEDAHFRVSRSDDCGASWNGLGTNGVSIHGLSTVETFYTDSFGNANKGMVNRARSSDAWIAVAPASGAVYAAHVRKDSSGFGQIYVAASTDEGQTWNSSRVTDGTRHSAFPEIAVNINGVIGVMYIDFDDSGVKTIFRHNFAVSSDGGGTWANEVLREHGPGHLEQREQRLHLGRLRRPDRVRDRVLWSLYGTVDRPQPEAARPDLLQGRLLGFSPGGLFDSSRKPRGFRSRGRVSSARRRSPTTSTSTATRPAGPSASQLPLESPSSRNKPAPEPASSSRRVRRKPTSRASASSSSAAEPRSSAEPVKVRVRIEASPRSLTR